MKLLVAAIGAWGFFCTGTTRGWSMLIIHLIIQEILSIEIEDF